MRSTLVIVWRRGTQLSRSARFVFPILALSAICPVGFGQKPVVDNRSLRRQKAEILNPQVADLLHSSDPAQKAWAAYIIQQNYLSEYIPDLVEILGQESLQKSPSVLLSAVLDSLIQLKAQVPLDIIAGMNSALAWQKILLLSNMPGSNSQALLALMRDNQGIAWLAAGNLLSDEKAPGFAGELLNELRVAVTISIVERGVVAGFSLGSGSGTGCIAVGLTQVPRDYPPIGFYEITDRPIVGAVVLAAGPHVVYYQRSVILPGQVGAPASLGSGDIDRNREIVEFLKALVGPGLLSSDLKPSEQFAVVWGGPLNFAASVREIKSAVKHKYQQVAAGLISKGLLTPDEALAATTTFHFELSDQRADRSVPLPQVSTDDVGILPGRVP